MFDEVILLISAYVVFYASASVASTALFCLSSVSEELEIGLIVLGTPQALQGLVPEREKAVVSSLGVLGNIAATEVGNIAIAEHNEGSIVKALLAFLSSPSLSASLKARYVMYITT